MNQKSYERFVKKNDDVKNDYVKNAEVIDEKKVEVEKPKKENKQKAVVTDCLLLCLREKPTTNSLVLKELVALSEVEVDLKNSTDSFYKVKTEEGLEGYCMKNYLVLKG